MTKKTVWRIKLEPKQDGDGIFRASSEIPVGFEVLKMSGYALWVLVDPEAKKVVVHFESYKTGDPIEVTDDLEYVDSVAGYSSSTHIFIRRDPGGSN